MLENWGRRARNSLSGISQLRVMPSRRGGFLDQLTTTSSSASSPVRSMAGFFCVLRARAMISPTDGRSSFSKSEGAVEGKESLICWKHVKAIGIKSPLYSRDREDCERNVRRERRVARGTGSRNWGTRLLKKARLRTYSRDAVSSREN
jgi:hypothetical protein